jgi:hypothetical protein
MNKDKLLILSTHVDQKQVINKTKHKQTDSWLSACKRTIPTDRLLQPEELIPTIFQVESVAWSAQRVPMTVTLSSLDQSRYFFFQVVPQLSSRG